MPLPDYGIRLAGLALAWLAGTGWQLHQASLWAVPVYALLFVFGLVGTGLALLVRRLWLLAWVLVALAGLGSAGLQGSARSAASLPLALEGKDLVVTGVVASLPQANELGVRFRFKVEEARFGTARVDIPELLALGWYRGAHEETQLADGDAASGLVAGQRWRFEVRLRRPHGNLNPHGFDYELWLFEQGLRATGYVRAGGASAVRPVLVDQRAGFRLERWRQHVRDAIVSHVPADAGAAGVLAALAVGDQAAISQDDWAVFRDSGTGHLMSISGLHVTMFAWLAGVVAGAAWRRSTRLALWMPAPTASLLTGLAAALAYALFSGWGVPAQRTVWMLLVVAATRLGGVRWPWPLTLLIAAVVVVAFDPWALLQPGFWLSFMAVGLLMASQEVRAARLERLPQAGDAPEPAHGAVRQALRAGCKSVRSGLRTQVVATVGLAPLTLVFFQQVSLVGLAANLIAIPVVTLLITPLALLGIGCTPLWTMGAVLARWLTEGLAWLAALPGAVWTAPVAPVWAQAAGLLAALVLMLPWPWRLRVMALPLALPLLVTAPRQPEAGHFDMLAVDVGQGTAVIVRTRHHVLVYDAGPQYSSDSDAGQRVLLPLLRARGETRIDLLMLSHRDADHVGGAAALLDGLEVQALSSSLEPGHRLLQRDMAIAPCVAGRSWAWDGVRFEVLHPAAADYAENGTAGRKANEVSCVLQVKGATQSALLTGDVEHAQERRLVAAHGSRLRSDVLLVPHHGSRTSSTAGFIDAVSPSMAVVQAGYRNRFGHPAAEVRARYEERGIELYESAECGAWMWSGGEPTCQRKAAPRYWHRTAAPPAAAPWE